MSNKPPLGIPPRFTYIEPRLLIIQRAINRYMASGLAVPVEWIEEQNTLVELLKNEWK